MGGMEKTTVYLSAEQKAALALTAASEGRSEATLIRAGIDVVTARHRAGEVRAPYAAGASADPAATPGPDLQPSPASRPRWLGREAFVARVLAHPADPGLRADLLALAPETTDDEPIP